MAKKNLVKTCIGIRTENMDRLDKWQTETGLAKSEIINMLIENAAKNNLQIQVTYNLGNK